jgi:hypothetical protein
MLGESGFQFFIDSVQRYFDTRNIAINMDTDEGVVRPRQLPMAHLHNSVFGLQNIAQVCHQAERKDWSQLIGAHFDTILATHTSPSGDNDDHQNDALRVNMRDFKKLQTCLRARLYPADIVKHASEVVARPGPPGTLEVLVLDLPTTVRTVARQEAAGWPFSENELLNIGRKNLRATGLLKANAVTLDNGATLHYFSGDNFYAASHAVLFDEYLAQHNPSESSYGALVGLPKRDILLVHFIRNIGLLEAIGSLLHAIIGMHRDGPGSITPNLYWYRAGAFVLLPYELEDRAAGDGSGGTLNFAPPADFVALMNTLSERANLS